MSTVCEVVWRLAELACGLRFRCYQGLKVFLGGWSWRFCSLGAIKIVLSIVWGWMFAAMDGFGEVV